MKVKLSSGEKGQIGEAMAWEFLRREHGMNAVNSDYLVEKPDGSYELIEVKYQEYFEPAGIYTFEAHGLTPYQFERYLKLSRATGIIVRLLVFDPKKKKVFMQDFETLYQSLGEDMKKYFDDLFDNKTPRPDLGKIVQNPNLTKNREYGRVLFPIDAFDECPVNWDALVFQTKNKSHKHTVRSLIEFIGNSPPNDL